MTMPNDLRASERIPISNRVQVLSRGRIATYALAVNISMGGVLLSAAPSLPVGSPCKLAILPAGDESGKKVVLEGTVIRTDAHGTAVRFSKDLEKRTYDVFAHQELVEAGQPSFLSSYLSYFKVSQNKDFEGCRELLGVSPKTFRTVFLSTFCTCIPLAILPVWALKDSIPMAPNWVKITASFGYAGVWLAIIQPSIDLAVFKYIRSRF